MPDHNGNEHRRLVEALPAHDPEAPPGSAANPLHQSALLAITDPQAAAFFEPGPNKVWGKTVCGTAFHDFACRSLRGEELTGADAGTLLDAALRQERRAVVWSETTSEAGSRQMLRAWIEAWQTKYLAALDRGLIVATELPMIWCDPLTGVWYATAGLDLLCAPMGGNVIVDWKTGDSVPETIQHDLYCLFHRFGWAAQASKLCVAGEEAAPHGVDWSRAVPREADRWLDHERPSFGSWPSFHYALIAQMAKGPRARNPWLIPVPTDEQTALGKVRRLTKQYLELFGVRPAAVAVEGVKPVATTATGRTAADADQLAWSDTDDAQSERCTMLIYGVGGSGKTSLCKTFGVDPKRVVYIGVDPGQKVLKGCKFRTLGPKGKAWTQDVLRAAYTAVRANLAGIDLLFIDGLDELGREILREMKKSNADGRRAYGEMGDFMEAMVKAFRDLPIRFVAFTTHIESHQDDVGRMYFRPTFPGKSTTEQLVNWFDMVGVVHAVTAGETATAERRLQFEQALDTRFFAKFRSQFADALGDWQPPDMQLVLDRVNHGKNAGDDHKGDK